jgi:hypothetical protein
MSKRSFSQNIDGKSFSKNIVMLNGCFRERIKGVEEVF